MSAIEHRQPDILLIMPDQMRGDCLSLIGHPALITPNIDEIGGQGTCFRRAYTPAASCIAARRSLMTGLSPASHGVTGYIEGIPLDHPTLPSILNRNGYFTALVGRNMHLSPYEEPYGYETRIHGSVYIPDDEMETDLKQHINGFDGFKSLGLSWNGWTARSWPYADHLNPINWTTAKSRQTLAASSPERPLFLTTSFYAPHPPFMPAEFYMRRYLDMELPLPSTGDWSQRPLHNGIGCGIQSPKTVLEGERLRTAQAGYFGSINQIDDQIFWLIDDFKQRSEALGHPWLIVFTSDHGEMLGDHYTFRKCEPYEGSIRIPLLIQASNDFGFEGGQMSDIPISLIDIMPTLLDAAKIKDQPHMDGQSLIPLLYGERTLKRDAVHSEHAPCQNIEQAYHMLTDGKTKYIWRPCTGKEQLFDLTNDPQEIYDLSSNQAFASTMHGWRRQLARLLQHRPEGFSDGQELISGRPYGALLSKSK